MVTRRAAKSKGNQFEYDCQASFEQYHNEVIRTAERGYQRQYDLQIITNKKLNQYIAIECKRHAKFSWNQLKKLYEKLVSKSPDAKHHYVLFQPNQQPCLVFYDLGDKSYRISEFESLFAIPFIKHKSTRAKNRNISEK